MLSLRSARMQVAISFDLTLMFLSIMRWPSVTQLLEFVFYKTILNAFSIQKK